MARRRRSYRQLVAGIIVGALASLSAAALGATHVPWSESGRTRMADPVIVAQRAPWACLRPAIPDSCFRIAAGVLEMIEALSVAQRPSRQVLETLIDVNAELGGDRVNPDYPGVLPIPTLAPGPTVAPPVPYTLEDLFVVSTSKGPVGCQRGDGLPCDSPVPVCPPNALCAPTTTKGTP
jgi:hypothetical protein